MTGAPRPVVVMGVSASGKSSIARALATALDCPFVEGDDLHPPENIAKMTAGVPLDDADRAPWLDRVAGALAAPDGWVVASCSALRRRYRDRLREAAPRVAFVLADADPDTLRRRIASRTGHFMPPALLDSQLATLERPDADERALVVDTARPLATNRDETIAWLRDLEG